MKMIVGLGNPGRQYQKTRHNIGCDLLFKLAENQGLGRSQSKFEADYFECQLEGEKVVLCAPTTYMNLSGRAVLSFAGFYKISPSDILVVCDDMNLPLGQLRFRAQGSAGGQKGLAHIIQVLGTEEVPRLRLGIGRPPEHIDAASYVLSRFTSDDFTQVAPMLESGLKGLICWVKSGIKQSMNEFNPGGKS